MSLIRVADLLIEECVKGGICDAFIVTGGGAMHLNDAIFKNKSIRKTFFHHEQSAAMAAEAYARIRNYPAIVNVTTGPGGINAINGVYGAYVDSIPMIVISGQVKKETMISSSHLHLRQLGDQEVDIHTMVKDITKYSCVLKNPDDTQSTIQKAIFIATHGRPGPVWLDVPIDVQSAVIDYDQKIKIESTLNELDINLNPSARNEFHLDSKEKLIMKIDLILSRLEKSKRPVLLVGNGVRYSNSMKELATLIKLLKIPVVTAWNAHDLVDDENDFYVGRPGTVGDRVGNFAVQNADFILILGCRLNIRQISYGWKSFAKHAWKTMVDIDSNELCKHTLNIDNKIHIDLKVFFQIILKRIGIISSSSEHSQYLNTLIKLKEKFPVLAERMISKIKINPYHFIHKLFKALGAGSTVVCGNGTACVVTFQVAKISKEQRLFTNSGSASMGYDLPAAIGASIALDNKKPVICIAGDGSLMMNIQELATVDYLQSDIRLILINNGGYSSIRQTQNNYFPQNIMGVDLKTGLGLPDFVRVSNAFSIPGFKIDKPNDIDVGIEWLLNGSGPKFLEVEVDTSQDFEPKLKSRVLADGSMASPELDDMFPFLSREDLENVRKCLNEKENHNI